MIEKDHPQLSIRRQSKMLGVNRNRLEKPLGKMTVIDTELIRLIDDLHMAYPFFGQRQLRHELRRLGRRVGRSRICPATIRIYLNDN